MKLAAIIPAAPDQIKAMGEICEPAVSEIQTQRKLHIPHRLGDVENLTCGISGVHAVGYEVGEIGNVKDIEVLPPEL
jgi:hypothetical protein